MRTFIVLSLFVCAALCAKDDAKAVRHHLSKLVKQDYGDSDLQGLVEGLESAMDNGCGSCMEKAAGIVGSYGGVLRMPPSSEYEKRQQEMMNVLMYYLYNEGYGSTPFPFPDAKCKENDPCDDYNPCTWDRCAWGQCVHLENPSCENNPYTCAKRGYHFCPFDTSCVDNCRSECPNYGFALEKEGGQCVMDCYYFGKSICNAGGDMAYCVDHCNEYECPLDTSKGGTIMNNWYTNTCFVDYKKAKKVPVPEPKEEGKCWDMGFYCEKTEKYVDSCCACPGANFPMVETEDGDESKPCKCVNRPGVWEALKQFPVSGFSEALDFHYDRSDLPCGVTLMVPVNGAMARALYNQESNLGNQHDEFFRHTEGNAGGFYRYPTDDDDTPKPDVPLGGLATALGTFAATWNYKQTFDFFFHMGLIDEQLHGKDLGGGVHKDTYARNRAGEEQEVYFFTDTDGKLCIGGPHYSLVPQYNVARVLGEFQFGHDTLFLIDNILVPETCHVTYDYDATEHSVWGGLGDGAGTGKFALSYACDATKICGNSLQCGKGMECLSQRLEKVDAGSVFQRVHSDNWPGGNGAFPGLGMTPFEDFSSIGVLDLGQEVGDNEERLCTNFEEEGYGTSCLGICQVSHRCYGLNAQECSWVDDCTWRKVHEGDQWLGSYGYLNDIGCVPIVRGQNPGGVTNDYQVHQIDDPH